MSAALPTTISKPNEKPMRNDGGVTTSQRQAPPSATKLEPNSEDQNVDISHLVSAIAEAACAGRQQMISKYLCKLPTLNSSHNDWLAFKSTYIDTVSSFSKVENTARLKEVLKDKDKEAITRLLIVNAEPSEFIRALEMRFRRPDSIALAELGRLRNILRPTNSLRDICLFANSINNSAATLQILDCIHYLYNPEIVKNFIDKLTPTLRYRWFDFTSEQATKELDLLKFDEFIEKEAERCRRSERRESNCAICKSVPHRLSDCATMKNADCEARWKEKKKEELEKRTYSFVLRLAPQTIEKRDLKGCRYLRNIEEFLKNKTRNLAIAHDNWHLFVYDRMKRGSRTQPVVSRTPLGWILHGTHTRSFGRPVHYIHHVAENNMEEIIRATLRSPRLRLRRGERGTCPILLSYIEQSRGKSESCLIQRSAAEGEYSPCIALYIKNFNAEMHLTKFPETVESIVTYDYVDVFLQTFENVKKATRIANEVQNIHRKANLYMNKWTSNTKEVIAALDPSTKYIREVKINDGDHGEKVLGQTSTQKAWRIGIGWDEQQPEKLSVSWETWITNLNNLREIKIPRYYSYLSHAIDRDLHIFLERQRLSLRCHRVLAIHRCTGCIREALRFPRTDTVQLTFLRSGSRRHETSSVIWEHSETLRADALSELLSPFSH
ncbi:hypothetical protein EVAR_47270_1 [Eumeta japonica]|uniref:Uncharacterized protein n=1 Tax=Eumeta variegata TaxID=151549 RepID=A0A4C1XJK4_EUMVA|nr:hypothetical protein EVAR_47270_1 [Eumeta japonica]